VTFLLRVLAGAIASSAIGMREWKQVVFRLRLLRGEQREHSIPVERADHVRHATSTVRLGRTF